MQNLSAHELQRWLDEGRALFLVDVREDFERELFNIGGHHLPMSELGQRWSELRQDKPIVLYCEKGIRSAIAIQRLEGLGLPPMHNLEGGMKAWKTRISQDFAD